MLESFCLVGGIPVVISLLVSRTGREALTSFADVFPMQHVEEVFL